MQIIANKDEQQERLEICFKCPDLSLIPLINIAKCNSCGCPLRTKVIVANTTCPKGKW